ncbi:uncharacterized protein LOC113205080 [Frankliniella occidentalis]|uniref:Uncharacterized protein LOC113205080 n=1 Tax=Frankliniella occidentalis TaxID=133901 RepID=A0A6J1S545_FRAOC|nr:uncharacterized protein LOC113205080 [Frankliniella occidentalis]XP_052120960.1 uncharacterized protein LOC113205080 [Frankliniella occidentalis]
MAPAPFYPEGMVPPDGGYGWVVAAAYALNNIIIIPIMQNFGLVFRDIFIDLGISTTRIAVIMNLNNAFGLALGLFNGPILRRFSYRKVALFGSFLVFVGVVLTSFSRSFVEFLIFYGIIMSAGYNLTMASFAFAINTYFRKRRGVAMGFAMTVTGLGPVFMPLLISLAMREYGARSTALLLGALSLHSVVGAFLLQPVRWHLVREAPDEKDNDDEEMVDMAPKSEGLLEAVVEAPEDEEEGQGGANGKGKRKAEKEDEEGDAEDDGKAPMLLRRRYSTASHKSGVAVLSRATSHEHGSLGASVWASMASINADHADLGGSVLALNVDEKAANNGKSNGHHKAEMNGNAKLKDADKKDDLPTWRRWMRAVVLFFDLDLLRDPVYVNLMLGLSFAVFAEINFSLLTPFILGERNFDTDQIAQLVSIIAVADIIFRFLAPFVKKVCKQPVRVMYMIGLALLIATRTVLIFCYSYESLIGVMLALGVAKGLRTVYWVLVIPDYVPIERLPSASGLQSVTNGLIFMALGPLVGLIRDRFGSYNYVIITVNCMTALTITMWSTEFAILAVLRRRKGRTAKEGQVADEEKMLGAKTVKT